MLCARKAPNEEKPMKPTLAIKVVVKRFRDEGHGDCVRGTGSRKFVCTNRTKWSCAKQVPAGPLTGLGYDFAMDRLCLT